MPERDRETEMELKAALKVAINAVQEMHGRLGLDGLYLQSASEIGQEAAQEYKDRAEEVFRIQELSDRTKPFMRIGRRSSTFEQIREFHRFACYRLQCPEAYFSMADVTQDAVWSLSDVGIGDAVDMQDFEDMRTYMGARIAWIERQRRLGRECYPEHGRYSYLLTRPACIRDALGEDKKWIVDYAAVLPLELELLLSLTYHLKNLFAIASHHFGRMPLKEDLDMKKVTTPWTREALDSGHHECEICRFKFGTEFSDEECVEPAIKAACGHVLGEMCTRNWVKGGNRNCPICTRPLLDLERALPAKKAPLYRKIRLLEIRNAELDPRVDNFFLAKPQVCNGVELQRLLEAQNSIIADFGNAEDEKSKMLPMIYDEADSPDGMIPLWEPDWE
ncbi:uncharacterized protein EI97DRAFT_282082 [Westerdykella ornata]|uniref:RING-type domain-containing protein n=1 Tax=Westerdykella ornata TaxID=318751 RepID=A0A6A6JNF2_WESOR|nr:uncharacterized protein EI97DRAFT_282082 [Westerdykella ornata]KAF2278047.1 hypothetical protein EI97DRAFT_282082 [Westerdykella ornata]